jgi:hypothetical protein
MDQKIMSNVDDWMKISDKVVPGQYEKRIVVDEFISSSELLKFFMQYPEFSPLKLNPASIKGMGKTLPNNVSPDCPASTYYIGIKDLEIDCSISSVHRPHSQTLSLFAFIFEKMRELEKQNESQQQTLDFVLEQMSVLEKKIESQKETIERDSIRMSALEKQNEIALEKQHKIQQDTLERMLEDECDAVFSR